MRDYIECRVIWLLLGGYTGMCWAFLHQGFYQHIFFLWFVLLYVGGSFFIGTIVGLIFRYLDRRDAIK